MAVGPNSGLLSDVELPPWAEGNGAAFLKVLREGLESDIVSENINHWIDLIFGYQQVLSMIGTLFMEYFEFMESGVQCERNLVLERRSGRSCIQFVPSSDLSDVPNGC